MKDKVPNVKNKPDFQDQVTMFFDIILGENPPDGILNICLKTGDKGLQTLSFNTADRKAIVDTVTRLKDDGDVYYEVCLQSKLPEHGKRGKAIEKSVMGGLWMDIDIKGPNHASDAYPKTKEEAMAFIMEITKATLIIFTGGGLHIYLLFIRPWIFKDEDDRHKGETLIKLFQRYIIKLGADRGWKIDSTHDLPRLLRPAGTFNHKRGEVTPVEIIHYDQNCRYSPEDFDMLLEQQQGEVHPVVARQHTSDLPDYPAARIYDIATLCGWADHCKTDACLLKEPIWFAMLSIIGRCENGRAVAHEWSAPYAKYTESETDDKLEKALKMRPRTCKSIRYELDGEPHCSHCPFWNNIKSPISLGDPNPTVQMKIRAVKILADSFDDRGLPFTPESLLILVSLQKSDTATYSRIRAGLASLNISVTKLEKEMKKFVVMSNDMQAEADIPYFVKNSSFYHVRSTLFGEEYEKLTNFVSRIVEEITKDDGAKVERFYKLKGEHADGTPLPDTEVSADSFKSMSWIQSAYGSKTVVFAGMGTQDHVRAAMQLSSSDIKRRVVYGHTGWRKIADEWLYLTSCGALGASGLLADINVELGDKLNFYALPGLANGISIQEAVRISLKFLNVAPAPISYGLFASVYRAPLGEVDPIDFSDFLHGFTGTLKSELAAIAQGHFGADFRGKNLPAAWSSTANFLERMAFLTKDAVMVVDDFLPGGSTYEAATMHAKADRVLRSQGNLSGRGRMASDTSLRKTFHPRDLTIGTGEDIPKGQSLRARLYLMEIKPGDVNLKLLTELQRRAATGVLAGAMAGYIQWLAPKIDTLKETFPQKKIELRDRASKDVKSHLRSPEIIASKMLGMDTFLKFAVEVKAITESQATDIWQTAWKTFCDADAVQAELQQTEDPVLRFIDFLKTSILMGQAHVEEFTGGSPILNATAWGWETGTLMGQEILKPKGKKIGWISGTNLYLDPDASYMVVQEIASRSGSPLTISPIVLRKRMDEKELIQQKVKGNLIKWMDIQGMKYKILHILTTALGNAADVTPVAVSSVEPEPDFSDVIVSEVPNNFMTDTIAEPDFLEFSEVPNDFQPATTQLNNISEPSDEEIEKMKAAAANIDWDKVFNPPPHTFTPEELKQIFGKYSRFKD